MNLEKLIKNKYAYHPSSKGGKVNEEENEMKLIDGNALEKAMTVAAVNDRKSATRTWTKAICLIHDAKVIAPEDITYGQQNFAVVASDNTDYTLTYKDGIYSVADKYGHMICEFTR